ncbi:MAG TPA: methyltransferase domain-containing protein [Allosphingosinicella sp.]|jgi:SAM-dependent methyltransferase
MTSFTTDAPGPRDPQAFARLMRHQDYPRASGYDPAWVFANLMGPNCLWLAEDLARSMAFAPGQRVLDLGCGKALTAAFLAREYGVQVWAADLWIDPADNLARAREAGVADRLLPLRAEAHRLPFAHGFFDAVVSVDAFHYFGTEVRYLSYLAQFVRPGGRIGMASPANAVDPDDAPAPLSAALFDAFGADWFTFRSADWWRRHWQRTRGIAVEEAAMIERGRDLWLRSMEAAEAWSGVPVAEQPDAALLFAPEGATLGFCRIVARRVGEEPTLEFGPGAFATRIA